MTKRTTYVESFRTGWHIQRLRIAGRGFTQSRTACGETFVARNVAINQDIYGVCQTCREYSRGLKHGKD